MSVQSKQIVVAREGVAELPLYRAEAGDCAIDLSDNTNLWGAPPSVQRVLRDVSLSVARYPSLYSEPLRADLLRYAVPECTTDVDVVTGCGSDDVLDSTMRSFGAPGSTIAFSAPTFSMIPYLARLNDLSPIAVPFGSDGQVDAERLVDARAAITYVCSPNNPTGTAVSRSALRFIVERASGMVVLDEAYAEFAPEVFVDFLPQREHLIVVRTFSKAFGMAGLRVGFGLGTPEVVRLVERARGPYKVSTLAERCVGAALDPGADGLEWVRHHAALAVENRPRLVAALAALGLFTLPTAANFVCIATCAGEQVFDRLRERGILVRLFSGLPTDITLLSESGGIALRVGVGPWDQMQALLDALTEILPCE